MQLISHLVVLVENTLFIISIIVNYTQHWRMLCNHVQNPITGEERWYAVWFHARQRSNGCNTCGKATSC